VRRGNETSCVSNLATYGWVAGDTTYRCGVEGFRGWPDPEERRIRFPDSGSGHTPPRGEAKLAGGLDPKSMETCIKFVIRLVKAWYR
jgi:hypothetical protein